MLLLEMISKLLVNEMLFQVNFMCLMTVSLILLRLMMTLNRSTVIDLNIKSMHVTKYGEERFG